jgi:hypothetical protein
MIDVYGQRLALSIFRACEHWLALAGVGWILSVTVVDDVIDTLCW